MDRRIVALALAVALIRSSPAALAEEVAPGAGDRVGPADVMLPPPNVGWSLVDNVTACPAGDSVVAGHPCRLRITVSYSDANFHVKNGVPPESIWAFVRPNGSGLKVNDETKDDLGPMIFADDSTRGGQTRITVPSFSGCGSVRVTLYVSGVAQGFKNANVRTVDTNADANRRVTSADQTGYCDLNYDGSTNSTDLALVTAHLNHWHHNTLYGTMVRRTNLCETCSSGQPNTMGSGDASWSPDGVTLSYSSHNASGNCSLKLVASDPRNGGDAITELTSPPVGVEDYDPSWSPLGDYIFWDRDDDEIYKKDPSSPSNPEILVFQAASAGMLFCTQGAVSPDGQQFVFCALQSGGFQNLWKVRADGTGLTRLTNLSDVADQFPKWSTDGQTIVFFRYEYGNQKTSIWKIPSDGGTATQLLAPQTNAIFSAYSPDDSVIACGIDVGTITVTHTFDPGLGLAAPTIPAYTQFGSAFSQRFSPDGTRLAIIARAPGVPSENSSQLWAARRNMSLPPSITSLGGQAVNNARPVVDFTAIPGTALNIVVSAVDPEADPITYAAYFLRTDLGMTFNVANRTFTWNAPITASDSVYFVRFQVSTFSGGSDYAIARITVADRMPPAAVTDLHPFLGHTTAVVTWTSPGDNGNVGNATAFDLRYSITSIDEGTFSSATPIFTSPPGPPGSQNCAELSGLSPCGVYWFAVKTVDDAGNWSFLSNVPFGQASCNGSLEFACGGPQQGQHAPQAKAELPKALEFGLRGPNPTREPVAVSFGVPPDRSGLALQLAVFDIAGRRLRELRGERAVSGRFQASWDLRDHDGRRVPAGLYFLRLGVGADRLTRSILVLN